MCFIHMHMWMHLQYESPMDWEAYKRELFYITVALYSINLGCTVTSLSISRTIPSLRNRRYWRIHIELPIRGSWTGCCNKKYLNKNHGQ